MKKKGGPKSFFAQLKKFWRFIWYDDSLLSWVLNIILAFIFIKFLLFPGLGFAFQSELPIVAVVSGSMEHKQVHPCYEYVMDGICTKSDKTSYDLCGKSSIQKQKVTLDVFWNSCGSWYENKNISQSQFSEFPFSNGFNIGDVMFIHGKSFEQVTVGDIIVFRSFDGIPIIHRVVRVDDSGAEKKVQTKGDHNAGSIAAGQRSELAITQEQYIGTAVAKLPFVGYVKLLFVRLLLFVMGIFA